MSKLKIRKCAGCGAPLKSNSSSCGFCSSENIEDSPYNKASRFDILMTSTGPKLINVIKLIRKITNSGLKEAKDLTDCLPSYIIKDLAEIKKEEYIRKFESLGASIEIRVSNSTEAIYRSPETGSSDDVKNKNKTNSGPGCLTLTLIIFSIVLIMCGLIILFGLDDILNL